MAGPLTEDEIRELFEMWQVHLGLQQWRITVVFRDIDPPTTTMQVHRSRDYERATVHVNSWVLAGDTPDDWNGSQDDGIVALDIEEAVVHELLHCCIDRLWTWVDMIRPEAHEDAVDTAVRAWEHHEEAAVDRIAVALVASFGLTGGNIPDTVETQ